ncbi:hypothetical protein TNCV_4034951 [Trichonephila clavipes]|nr:hypothetical protein TNCV_4034951 [Trichonephila clavipes]
MVDKKTDDLANCKEQLALTVRGERRFRRIVRSQRSQTLAQIATQLNDGVNCIISKQQRCRMGFREPSIYESTIAQWSSSGCTSCLDKRA